MTDSSKDLRPVAVITGASSGLGKAYAQRLAKEGFDLFLVARRGPLLDELAEKLMKDHGIEVEVCVADLSDPEDLKQVEETISSIPSLTYLINNAGFGANGVFPDVDIEAETKMILVHCVASMRLSQAALLPMVANNKGYIINVASVAGFLNADGAADYNATKAFLIAFSKSLHCDVARRGVRVQALCPGFVRTGFHDTEGMKNSNIKKNVPGFLWLKAERVVNTSLRAIRRCCCYRVVCIPSLLYKTITYFGSEWIFSPIRILFSRGRVR